MERRRGGRGGGNDIGRAGPEEERVKGAERGAMFHSMQKNENAFFKSGLESSLFKSDLKSALVCNIL